MAFSGLSMSRQSLVAIFRTIDVANDFGCNSILNILDLNVLVLAPGAWTAFLPFIVDPRCIPGNSRTQPLVTRYRIELVFFKG